MREEAYSVRQVSVSRVAEFISSVCGYYEESSEIPGLLEFGSRPCDEAFAAEFQGEIVGVATVSLNDSDHPTPGVLDTLYVDPSHRRRRLGVRLA